MPTNPVPVSELGMTTDRTPTEIIVRCTGKITSNTIQSLKATVKSLFSESKSIVLDLTHVSYLDSSGLGAIVGLYVSAKTANSQLKLINLKHHDYKHPPKVLIARHGSSLTCSESQHSKRVARWGTSSPGERGYRTSLT